MTLFDISATVREVGHIWLIDHPAFGTLFRASINGLQVRIVVPRPGQQEPVDIPAEKNPLHIATDRAALYAWLRSIAP